MIARNSFIDSYTVTRYNEVTINISFGSECSIYAGKRQSIFKRKILRKIYGPIHKANIWRIRNKGELNRVINRQDIVKFIKAQRIRWLGHVTRVEVGAMPRKMMEGRLFTGRRKGRPHLRRMDNVVL
jgi:hypothetical protein